MFKFIFKMNDGSSYTIHNVPKDFIAGIWNKIDEYCSIFETKTKKVRSVIQEAI